MTVGGVTLELSYKGENHCPGNIFIYAPAQKVLTVIDIVSPGSATFMHCDASQNITGWYRGPGSSSSSIDFDFLVAGHHMKYGTPETVAGVDRVFRRTSSTARRRPSTGSQPVGCPRSASWTAPAGTECSSGTENWINSMANYATKYVLEKQQQQRPALVRAARRRDHPDQVPRLHRARSRSAWNARGPTIACAAKIAPPFLT
ncbi:hypothetical protein [Rhizobium yanglingense]